MKNHQNFVNKNFLRTLRRKQPQEFGPNVRGGGVVNVPAEVKDC